MAGVRQRAAIVAVILIGAFIVDQASKWWILNIVMQPPRVITILPFFNLTLGFNTGVSFGLFRAFFEDWPQALAGAKLLVVLGLIGWALAASDSRERHGLALIAGGALGNIWDRWRQGAVTDFLDLHAAGWHWPTFNMADVAITLGVGLILLAAVLPGRTAVQAGA